MTKKNHVIKLKNIWKTFQMWEIKTDIIKNVNLDIYEWDFVAIVWPSWSWKSTILNMIWLLDKPSSGEIFINEKNINTLNENQKAKIRSNTFWFIFQQYNLIPWLSAYENITLPLLFAEKDHKILKIKENIETIWLKNRINHKPSEMSWWEQQRVALLRALANDPQIILGDEPTWNLDSNNGEKILKILMNLNKVQKKTLIIITHDMNIANNADKIIKIKDWRIQTN